MIPPFEDIPCIRPDRPCIIARDTTRLNGVAYATAAARRHPRRSLEVDAFIESPIARDSLGRDVKRAVVVLGDHRQRQHALDVRTQLR